jgi:hypothetical protein
MIDQHLGRRSVSDFQRGVLALRKREILAERRLQAASLTADIPLAASPQEGGTPSAAPEALKSREDIAKAARLSSSQVVMIEKIRKQATPEVVAAVKSGAISINAAAAVATLPAEEQVAAATAGKDQLKQAAKRVREARRMVREEQALSVPAEVQAGADTSMLALQRRVAELEAENAELRRQLIVLQTG